MTPPPAALLARRAPLVAALVALVAALATMTSDPVGVFNDDGIYLLTAQALAEGQGYVYPHLPGTPAAIHYPPGWPLLLAAAWKLTPAFPANLGWLKLINPLLLALASALAVRFGERVLGLPWWAAFAGTVAAVVTVPVLLLTNLLLSEPLFLLLALPTFALSERLVRDGGVRLAAGAGALVAALVLVRTLGGVVLVATLLLLSRERRWREGAVYAAVAVLLLLPWQLFVWRASATFPDELRGSYGPYLEWVVGGYRDGGWPFLSAVLAKNLEATRAMVGIFFSPLVAGPVRDLLAVLATATFGAGCAVLAARRRAPVTILALLGYLAVVIAWPFWVDRFLWVLWPVLVLIAVAGVLGARAALLARGRPRAAGAVVAVGLLLALGHTTYNARGLPRGWAQRASGEMTAAAIRIVRHINDDRSLDGRLLAAELAPLVALYTGARVLPVEILTPREHVVEKTDAERVNELERIDRRFRPEAYVVMEAGPYYRALRAATLDSGRTLRDVSAPGAPVRTLLASTP